MTLPVYTSASRAMFGEHSCFSQPAMLRRTGKNPLEIRGVFTSAQYASEELSIQYGSAKPTFLTGADPAVVISQGDRLDTGGVTYSILGVEDDSMGAVNLVLSRDA